MMTINPDEFHAAMPQEIIRSQVERIIKSPEFENSEKLGSFLRYVVEQALQGNAKRIKQYTIAVEAFGHSEDFDPQADTSIRVLGGRLRRALKFYNASLGAGDPVRIEIPKRGFVPIFFQQGSSTAMVEVPRPSEIDILPSLPDTLEPVIAVYFLDSGNNEECATLARGLTGELLVSLGRFSGLRVMGPLIPAEENSIENAVNESNNDARFSLRGFVRSQGERIRVTTELTKTLGSKALWGRTFDYDLESTTLFEIEDNVTSQVVGSIADDLGIIFREMISDNYKNYLKLSEVTKAVISYNNAWLTQSPKHWQDASRSVSTALSSHPDNALLIALRSNIYYADALYGLGIEHESRLKMEPLALKAVAMDPDLQIAKYNLVVQNAFFARVGPCVETAEEVVAMNPNNARILAGCAVAVTSVGAYDRGLDYIERAKQLNPHYPGWYHFVPYLVHLGMGRFEESWNEVQRINVEGLYFHPLFRASALGHLGRAEEAQGYIHELMQLKPDFLKRPQDYIKPLFVLDRHVDIVCRGLYLTGLPEAHIQAV